MTQSRSLSWFPTHRQAVVRRLSRAWCLTWMCPTSQRNCLGCTRSCPRCQDAIQKVSQPEQIIRRKRAIPAVALVGFCSTVHRFLTSRRTWQAVKSTREKRRLCRRIRTVVGSGFIVPGSLFMPWPHSRVREPGLGQPHAHAEQENRPERPVILRERPCR